MDILGPELQHLGDVHWYLDCQSGPFDVTVLPDGERAATALDAYFIAVPQLLDTSASLWRPAAMLQFGHALVEDEWSYIVGIPGPEDPVRRACELHRLRYLSPQFFGMVEREGLLFACRVTDRWWEWYGPWARDVFRADLHPTDVESEALAVSAAPISKGRRATTP